MIHSKYILDTANHTNYLLAKAAAKKAGMITHNDYRPTCFKCYRLEMTANTTDADFIMNLIILATTEHKDTAKYKKQLTTYTHSNFSCVDDFIDFIRE